MENNPFVPVIQAFKDGTKMPAAYRIGTVISITPLTIDVAGTNQDQDDFLKNDILVTFEIGDQLLLIPIDDEQRYIIVCKVVSA